MTKSTIKHSLATVFVASVLNLSLAWAQPLNLDATVAFDIAAQPFEAALLQLSRQADCQLAISTSTLPPGSAPRVSGKMSIKHAVELLLKDTELSYKLIGERTLTILPAGSAKSVAARDTAAQVYKPQHIQLVQTDAPPTGADPARENAARESTADPQGIPEILVKDSRILNMDIRRSRDDAQPYVIFDRATLERSGAQNLDEFFKTRLTMNTQGASNAQVVGSLGNTSQINLRGLGVAETLILVDGRRIADVSFLGGTDQPDINGIPLAAVERIEVLPTTASGIYGGGATGGVINIILRRDYEGMQVKATYDNTFDSDSAIRRLDFSSGLNLEGGKTNILLAASYSDSNILAVRDRDFARNGRARVMRNNPAVLLPPAVPPLSSTPNIRSSTGANLVLKAGLVPLNSLYTYVPAGYAGPASDNGVALLANAGKYNLDLAESKQLLGGGLLALATDPVVESATATIRRQFGSRLQLFVEGAAADNTGNFSSSSISRSFNISAASPLNPFVQNIQISAPVASADFEQKSKTTTRRVGVGAIFSLSPTWQLSADYDWNRATAQFSLPPRTATAPVNAAILAGTFNLMRDLRVYPVDVTPYLQNGQKSSLYVSTLNDATVRVGGPVWSLPAGRPMLSALVEHRELKFDSGLNILSGATQTIFTPQQLQRVDSAYAEVTVPLISARNAKSVAKLLEVQLAGRYDLYHSDGGRYVGVFPNGVIDRAQNKTHSTNPTVGLRYQPVEGAMFRASFGTGFLPPTGNQLVPTFRSTVSLIDPRRGGETVILPAGDYFNGGNPDLRPEESISWSAGMVLTPAPIPGLRLSLDYTWIEKTDIITSHPDGAQGIVNDETLFPDRVTRGPKLTGDPAQWAGPITGLDATLLNLSHARIEAYDLAVDYRLDTAHGVFDFFTMATLQPHYITQLLPTSPEEEQVGRDSGGFGGPAKLKANAGVTWSSGPWALGWTLHYFDSYRVAEGFPEIGPAFDYTRTQGAPLVASQIYHDVFAEYDFPATGLLADTEVTLGIRNLFNTAPPFDASNVGEYYSYFGDPRLASYSLSIRKSW